MNGESGTRIPRFGHEGERALRFGKYPNKREGIHFCSKCGEKFMHSVYLYLLISTKYTLNNAHYIYLYISVETQIWLNGRGKCTHIWPAPNLKSSTPVIIISELIIMIEWVEKKASKHHTQHVPPKELLPLLICFSFWLLFCFLGLCLQLVLVFY